MICNYIYAEYGDVYFCNTTKISQHTKDEVKSIFKSIAFKMKNMKNDCELISNKNHIPFKWNEKFPINSISIMRGYLFINKEKRKDYLDKFFNAYWRDNVDLSIQENFINILNTLEIDQEIFLDGISNEKIKVELKELTSEAFNSSDFIIFIDT